MFFVACSLPMIDPGPAFAWHDYTYREWDWHGSGRDYPYSYYIDNYYSPVYRFSPYDLEEPSYINYINSSTTPTQAPILSLPDSGAFTVNVPNSSGGYTAVLIKRSGNGYIGPQGEFYPEFPKVSLLKLMYGK